MVVVDASIKRYRMRHSARLELWAAREHARLRAMAQGVLDRFEEPALEPMEFGAMQDPMRNAAPDITPEQWAAARRAYFEARLYPPLILCDEAQYVLREDGWLGVRLFER